MEAVIHNKFFHVEILDGGHIYIGEDICARDAKHAESLMLVMFSDNLTDNYELLLIEVHTVH